MNQPTQPDLFAPRPADVDTNVPWFIALIERAGTTWTTSAQVLQAAGRPVTEEGRRWVRLLREATHGRIIGGPGSPGYRDVRTMTAAEYNHWRNQMKSQSDQMTRAILESDHHFYTRQPVAIHHGILPTSSTGADGGPKDLGNTSAIVCPAMGSTVAPAQEPSPAPLP